MSPADIPKIRGACSARLRSVRQLWRPSPPHDGAVLDRPSHAVWVARSHTNTLLHSAVFPALFVAHAGSGRSPPVVPCCLLTHAQASSACCRTCTSATQPPPPTRCALLPSLAGSRAQFVSFAPLPAWFLSSLGVPRCSFCFADKLCWLARSRGAGLFFFACCWVMRCDVFGVRPYCLLAVVVVALPV